MKYNVIIALMMLSSTYAYQDPEDDIMEMLRELHKKNSAQKDQPEKKQPSKEPIIVTKPQPKPQEPVKPAPVTYQELSYNFNYYKTNDLNDLKEIVLDKETLLKEAHETVKAFEMAEQKEYDVVEKFAAFTAWCAVFACAPWVPSHASEKLHTYIKCGISTVAVLGMVYLGVMTSKQYAEYKELADEQKDEKAHHEEVRDWLLSMNNK